jgi:hypothetical protein
VRLRRIAFLVAALGAALIAAGALIGPDTSWVQGIEGAYFTRAAGTPAYSGVLSRWGDGPDLLSVHDGNLWIGAGIACCTFALGLLVAPRLMRAEAGPRGGREPREPGDAPSG